MFVKIALWTIFCAIVTVILILVKVPHPIWIGIEVLFAPLEIWAAWIIVSWVLGTLFDGWDTHSRGKEYQATANTFEVMVIGEGVREVLEANGGSISDPKDVHWLGRHGHHMHYVTIPYDREPDLFDGVTLMTLPDSTVLALTPWQDEQTGWPKKPFVPSRLELKN